MRLLFTSTPALGHVIPLLALARAAGADGHEVAFLTDPSVGGVLDPFPVLSVGPDLATVLRLADERHPGRRTTDFSPDMVAEAFVDVRVEQGGARALDHMEAFKPDLVIADEADFLGPFAASLRAVPWVQHRLGMDLPSPVVETMLGAFAQVVASRGGTPASPVAVVEVWPDSLQLAGWTPAADRTRLRSEPYRTNEPWTWPRFAEADRPTVLVTLGTLADDSARERSAVASILAETEANVLVTAPAAASPIVEGRVAHVGFVPLADLLPGVDAVVSAGGAGTTLAVLGAGTPMVVLPGIADQFLNAERIAASGSGIAVDDPEAVGGAAFAALHGQALRMQAQRIAEQIAGMTPASDVLRALLRKIE